jgi:RNA polymerase sigma factor (sigma-70 family)
MDIDKFFEAIFRFYYGKVYSYAYRRLGSKWAAEEVTQSIFEKLWLHHNDILSRHSFHDVADINGYIFAMTRNAVTDWYRDNASIRQIQEERPEAIRPVSVRMRHGLHNNRHAAYIGRPRKWADRRGIRTTAAKATTKRGRRKGDTNEYQ